MSNKRESLTEDINTELRKFEGLVDVKVSLKKDDEQTVEGTLEFFLCFLRAITSGNTSALKFNDSDEVLR